jgi:Zn-finger nucleic acid-binding protein
MNCPNCKRPLKLTSYEGIGIETCEACGGAWLDAPELGKIVALRQVKFSENERQSIAKAAAIRGVVLSSVDRNLVCPKCGGTTDPVNFGGDTGIIIDRCTKCQGMWLDKGELEKIELLVEGWNDMLPADADAYRAKMQLIASDVDRKLQVQLPTSTLLGGLYNSIINPVLDFFN